jgi:hypothetical protein
MQVYREGMNQQGGPPGQYPGGYGPPAQAGAQPPRKPITGSAETMALHAMSIDPKTGLPRGEKPPASTAAVIALVCGILICLGPLTGFTAIIAGFVGRSRARARPDAVGGVGMATAGIVLGFVNLALSLVGGLILLEYSLQ